MFSILSLWARCRKEGMGITFKSPKLSQKKMVITRGGTWLRQILLLSFVTILPFFIPSKTALKKKEVCFSLRDEDILCSPKANGQHFWLEHAVSRWTHEGNAARWQQPAQPQGSHCKHSSLELPVPQHTPHSVCLNCVS